MSQQAESPPPIRSISPGDSLIHNNSPDLTTKTSASNADDRAIEAAGLVNLTKDLTHYEWESLKQEVDAYSTEEWRQMPLEWKKSMIKEVIEDAKKMELIRDTMISIGVRESRVDEIIFDIAEAANERIQKEGFAQRKENHGGDGEDTLYSRRKGKSEVKLEVKLECEPRG